MYSIHLFNSVTNLQSKFVKEEVGKILCTTQQVFIGIFAVGATEDDSFRDVSNAGIEASPGLSVEDHSLKYQYHQNQDVILQ